jgi:hypothetical protein
LACTLCACTSTMTSAWMQTFRASLKTTGNADDSRLNPIYRHLRVSISGRTAFVTLGDLDQHPDGAIEVFYSGGREVIRMQNGRIAGITGLLTEWRNVNLHHAPTWAAASRAASPLVWLRVRDVMPGYRYGIHDQIEVRAIAPPARSALQDISPDSLAWFEERTQLPSKRVGTNAGSGQNTGELLPPARYAVVFDKGRETVIYAEQCIAPDLCFTWQHWTPKNR